MKPKVFELLDRGFFDDVIGEGNVSAEELVEQWKMFSGRKYALKYYLKHHEVAPTWGSRAMNDPEKAEEVYKEALEKGKTWQEITGYKEKEGILL